MEQIPEGNLVIKHNILCPYVVPSLVFLINIVLIVVTKVGNGELILNETIYMKIITQS